MLKPKPIRLPLDVHPKVSKSSQAASGLEALQEAQDAINDALLKVTDPRSLGKAIADRSAAALKRAQKALATTEAAGSFFAKGAFETLTKRGEFEKEIRDVVRASKNPAAEVRRMIADGDTASVAAVFRAPPRLSGLDQETFDSIYEYAKATLAPDQHKGELAQADGAARLRRAVDLFTKETARISKAVAGSDDAIVQALASPKPKEPADA